MGTELVAKQEGLALTALGLQVAATVVEHQVVVSMVVVLQVAATVVDLQVWEARARRHSYWSFVLLHLRIRTSWISYMWLEHSAPYGRSM